MLDIIKDKQSVKLNETQENKYVIILDVINGLKTKKRAAALLNLTERQINRLIKVAETEGPSGFIHKNTGVSPSNKIPDSIKRQIVSWYKDTYYDFSFSHFCEILHDEKNIKISRTSVANILFDADILSPKATKKTKSLMRRKLKQKNTSSTSPNQSINSTVIEPISNLSSVHPSRSRKKYFGELLQVDASIHNWFGDKITSLHIAIDDSTGMIVGAYFDQQETLNGYYTVLHQVLNNYGIPYELWTDKRTIFEYTSSKNKKIENDTFTQFGYACHQLGISILSSSVPQKKGRVERAFGTLQSRLVPLLRLENIQTIEEANKFLTSYLHVFNSQFSIPNYNTSKFEVVDNIDTNLVLSVNSMRKINSGYHFKYKNKSYIPINKQGHAVYYPIKTEVRVIKAFDGNLYVSINDSIYSTRVLEKHELESIEFDVPTLKKDKPTYIPPMSHPWRKNSFLKYISKLDTSIAKGDFDNL